MERGQQAKYEQMIFLNEYYLLQKMPNLFII